MAYVPRLSSQGIRGNRYWYSSMNPYWPDYDLPNCTCYAYGRWLEIAMGDSSKLSGLFTKNFGSTNGGNWYRASPGLQAGKTNPQLGDIACWGFADYRRNGWGHVAVVEEIYPTYIVVSASYASGTFFNTEPCPISRGYRCSWMREDSVRYNYVLHGFLRMGGAAGGVVPSIPMPTEWIDDIDYWIADGSDEEINNMVMAYVALSNADPTWTLEAICGVLGNMWRESHLNPGMREIGNPQNGGLVGWTPLTKWSHEALIRGIPWNDGDGQCEWVSSGDYWSGGTLYHNHWVPNRMDNPMTYAEYKQCTDTPEQCAKHFMQGYEGPLVPALAERQAKARYYYEYLRANLPFMTKEKGPTVPFSVLDYPCSAYEIKLR